MGVNTPSPPGGAHMCFSLSAGRDVDVTLVFPEVGAFFRTCDPIPAS